MLSARSQGCLCCVTKVIFMELTVFNHKGEDMGRRMTIPGHMQIETPNPHVIYLYVIQYLAAQRQGTHQTKTRGQVRGSTRKLRKQKGTGYARIGSIKSPLLRGGGHAFALSPRNYAKTLNKKTKLLARKTALWQKIHDQAVIVVENFTFDKPSTKQYLAFLQAFAIADSSSLLVFEEPNPMLYRSSANLKQAQTTLATTLNTYEILRSDKLILFEQALEALQNRWQ